MGKGDGQNASAMGLPGFDFLAAGHVPELDGSVFACAGEEVGIIAEGDGRDAGFMPGKIIKFRCRSWIPKPKARRPGRRLRAGLRQGYSRRR